MKLRNILYTVVYPLKRINKLVHFALHSVKCIRRTRILIVHYIIRNIIISVRAVYYIIRGNASESNSLVHYTCPLS